MIVSDFTSVIICQTKQTSEGRGLAAAVTAQQGDDLSLTGHEAYAF
jgi:hypothetical protein